MAVEPTAPYLRLIRARHRWRSEGNQRFATGHVVEGSSEEGVYAGWAWDDRTQELAIENDRYGFHPLFYFSCANELCVSPLLRTLLALGVPDDLDEQALAVFLRKGFYVGEDTPFRSIKAVPPDVRVTATPKGFELIGSLRLLPPTQVNRQEAIDTYIDRFRAAIERRKPGSAFALPLSGGRDSRHILLELVRCGHTPAECITLAHYPPRGNDDSVVASMIAGELGVRHVQVDQSSDWLHAELLKNIATSHCTTEHVQYGPLVDYLLGRGVETTYDGIGGDVLSGSLFLDEQPLSLCRKGRPEDLEEVTRYLVDGKDTTIEQGLRSLLSADAYRRFSRARAEERIHTEMVRHASCANPLGSFYFWNRTRRAVALAPFALMGRIKTVFAPYLDHDLFDFTAALPAELLLDGAFHTEAIHAAFPERSHIRFEQKTKAPRPWYHRALASRAAILTLRARTSLLRSSRLLATEGLAILRGSAEPLWYLPRAVYLMQLSRLGRE